MALALAALGAACGGDSPQPADCPVGFVTEGPACAPIFDECPGPAEISLLGGGCRTVGVTTCATGFQPDGAGGCDSILPPMPCAPGTMPRLGEAACAPVGVTQCAPGFQGDGTGGCEPVLPSAPCPDGTRAVLGETQCQPIADCGAAPWGGITVDATTIYVDGSFVGLSDGTSGAPYVTIAQAVGAASPGTTIAVAAGDYPVGQVRIDRPLRLAGRCPAMTRLLGAGTQDDAAVTIDATASGTTMTGFGLTGPGLGILVDGARAVVLTELEVLDTGNHGVRITAGSQVVVERTVVARAVAWGVISRGGELTLTDSVFRDGIEDTTGYRGGGVAVTCDSLDCGVLEAQGIVVRRNRTAGILSAGSDATIRASFVDATQPAPADGTIGFGIYAYCSSDGTCGSLGAEGVTVQGNRQGGIASFGTDTTIVGTTVRDTLPRQAGERLGEGIVQLCDIPRCGQLTFADSLSSGNHTAGIRVGGPSVTIDRTILADSRAPPGDLEAGFGLLLTCDFDGAGCEGVTVRDSLLEANRAAGVLAQGADVTLLRSVVVDTHPRAGDLGEGVGVAATCDESEGRCGTMRLEGTLITGNRAAGVVAAGVDAVIAGSWVDDTLPAEADGDFGYGVQLSCDSDVLACGTVELTGTIISASHSVGLNVSGAVVTFTDLVIRDTRGRGSDGDGGRGLQCWCDDELGQCADLQLRSSLLDGNREAGLVGFGCRVDTIGSIFRNTLPQESDGYWGAGFNVECSGAHASCGPVSIVDSLAANNLGQSVMVRGGETTVSGLRVRDTIPQLSVGDTLLFGRAFTVMCDAGLGCGTAAVSSSYFSQSTMAGVTFQVGGSFRDSKISGVVLEPTTQAYGFGLEIARPFLLGNVEVTVERSLVEGAALAAYFYFQAGGTLSRSVARGGEFPVVIADDAYPAIGADNAFAGSLASEPRHAQLDPTPSPPPSIPFSIQ